MLRRRIVPLLAAVLLGTGILWILSRQPESVEPAMVSTPARSEIKAPPVPAMVPGDSLLAGYGDPGTPPMEDLRKLQHVVSGYYSVVKDASRNAIGGNEDLSAALRGENPNREVFVRPGSGIFSETGLLTDRWGSPLIVHPQAWRQLELRSAGPDRIPYNEDDLVLQPDGRSGAAGH